MKRVAVLLSGEGRNFQALLDARRRGDLEADFVGVISNRPDANGLQRAAAAGVATAIIDHRDYPDRAAFDAALVEQLETWRAEWVVLAGFMRVLTAAFVTRFAGRLLNIHPSLLPRYPGLHTHAAVLAAGDREHGATVHFVTPALDAGPIIIQGQFTVMPEDDASQLAERLMAEVETHIYPQALAWCLDGRVRLIDGHTVCFDGRPLSAPLSLADVTAGA